LAVAYCTSTHCRQFGAQIPTRSPATISAQERRSDGVDGRVELAVRQPHIQVAIDDRRPVREARGDPLEVISDRVAEQGDVEGAVAVGRGGHGRIVHPPSTCGRACLR